ncbi:MAG: cofactor-independent phosphoglycerate mutase [Nitrospirae bacterium]|nr:cofactor-independent phosphoglycerate mutase [Nitrospirota bacterium]MBF0534462.1 cofactor-independent phosphoglycerate mutase [Nitrospirota bacterium]MBF0617088.1 cofactor-independent phosphoglycerate mutase [Nitrospirota bacterium]
MKYIVLIGDGMADRPIDSIGGQTPLMKAHTPNMDMLASRGTVGGVQTVPESLPPGSDVANLSILGYDPTLYYTGRAPFEALSMGIDLKPTDVAYRCNLVTLKTVDGQTIMEDYSSGHITTEEGGALIEAMAASVPSNSDFKFYPGISYRHLMVWENGLTDIDCTPPHDITGKPIAQFLPKGQKSDVLIDLMTASEGVLKTHEVNTRRARDGKKPATSIWLWGQGKRPLLPLFKEKYKLNGALISAVDLTRGLGVAAGLKIIQVPGITGYIDTNYEGKASYGVDALNDADFVYIHVEAPDEAGHTGNLNDKIKAIEDFDKYIVGGVLDKLKGRHDFRLLIMPDHATPICIKTHSREPVPFIIYDSADDVKSPVKSYDENIITTAGVMTITSGHTLMDYFISV